MLKPEDLQKPEVQELVKFLNPKIEQCIMKVVAVTETVFNETEKAKKDGRLRGNNIAHTAACFYTMGTVMRSGVWKDPFVQMTCMGYAALTGQSETSFHLKVLTAALAVIYWRSQGVVLNLDEKGSLAEFVRNN